MEDLAALAFIYTRATMGPLFKSSPVTTALEAVPDSIPDNSSHENSQR